MHGQLSADDESAWQLQSTARELTLETAHGRVAWALTSSSDGYNPECRPVVGAYLQARAAESGFGVV